MAGFEEGVYFREELHSDFMKFAFEQRNRFEESKRPLEMPIEPQKNAEGEDFEGNEQIGTMGGRMWPWLSINSLVCTCIRLKLYL